MPRRDFTKVPFAATGDATSIPTAVQPDGSVSMTTGYGFDYQRDNGAGGGAPDPLAKSIPRDATNGILNEITASIGEIQLNGLAIWAASAAPYPIHATVRHNNTNWRSTVANNSAQPGVAPLANWIDTTVQIAQATERVAGVMKIATQDLTNTGTDDAAAVTPKKLSAATQGQKHTAFTTTGTATAQILTPAPPITAYAATQRFNVTFNIDSGANPTINVSGQGPKSLKQYDSTGAKVSAVFAALQNSDIVYDGTDFVLLNQLPASPITVPPGAVLAIASNIAPVGCLKANGAVVSRTPYAALFAVIGTTFGAGDGSTTFQLPDLRGEFVRGWDDGRGVDAARAFGSLQLDAFQGHWHQKFYNAQATNGGGGNTYAMSVNPSGNNVDGIHDAVRRAISDRVNGTPRVAAETRPRNVALLYCIKI